MLKPTQILGKGDNTGRTRRGNKSTRIPEILDIAARLLSRDGYASFTTRRVAQEAGILLSTLQHYVGARDELLSKTLAGLIDQYTQLFQRATADESASPTTRLQTLLDACFAEFVRPAVANFWVEVWAMARHEPLAKELATKAYEQGTGKIQSLISEIRPDLPESEALLRARAVSVQLEGLMVLSSRYGEGPELDAAVNAAKAICEAIVTAAVTPDKAQIRLSAGPVVHAAMA
ncbi:TetR/AcrR family transcriptional regulator [Cupriavidus necator]